MRHSQRPDVRRRLAGLAVVVLLSVLTSSCGDCEDRADEISATEIGSGVLVATVSEPILQSARQADRFHIQVSKLADTSVGDRSTYLGVFRSDRPDDGPSDIVSAEVIGADTLMIALAGDVTQYELHIQVYPEGNNQCPTLEGNVELTVGAG